MNARNPLLLHLCLLSECCCNVDVVREFIVQNPCTMPAAKAKAKGDLPPPPPPPAARTGRRLGPLAALGGGLAVLAPLLAAYGLGGPAGPAARLAAAL